MRIANPLRLSEWDGRAFLRFALALQAIVFVLSLARILGFRVPLLTEFAAFLYLSFLPGFLVLRVLRVRRQSTAATLAYALGLSITFLYLFGVIANFLLPLFGVQKPLTTGWLLLVSGMFTLGLTAASYRMAKTDGDQPYLDLAGILKPHILFILLLPLLAILGALLVNQHGDNLVIMIAIALVALVGVIVAASRRLIPPAAYPLAVFCLALTLVYHRSLVPQFISGWDTHLEYYIYSLTQETGIWNTDIIFTYNTVLSNTILPTVYGSVAGLDGEWVFKVILPFFFAFTPLVLYEVYRAQMDERKAFFAVYLFFSFMAFTLIATGITKQALAQFFFALFLLLMVEKGLTAWAKAMLVIAFSASLAVSHYSTYYAFAAYIAAVLVISYLIRRYDNRESQVITPIYAAFLIVAGLTWYMYTSHSMVFDYAVRYADFVVGSLADMLSSSAMDTSTAKALGLLGVGSWTLAMGTWLLRLTTLFIGIGILRLLVSVFKRKATGFVPEFYIIALLSIVTMFAFIIVPYVNLGMGSTRFYLMALLSASPFCVTGGELVISAVMKPFAALFRRRFSPSLSTGILAILILIPYMLFNIGFMQEITGDPPSSTALSSERIRQTADPGVRITTYNITAYAQDVYSAKWLKSSAGLGSVYSDSRSSWATLASYGGVRTTRDVYDYNENRPVALEEVKMPAYVYLNTINVLDGKIVTRLWGGFAPVIADTEGLTKSLGTMIYDNGGSVIYYASP